MTKRQEYNVPSSPATYAAKGRERRSKWGIFPWVLGVGLIAPVQAQAPDLFVRVNDLFAQQLEDTFCY
jgi:hypothetical protein